MGPLRGGVTPRRLSSSDAAEAAARLSPHIHAWHAARWPELFDPEPDAVALERFFAGGLEGPETFAFGIGAPVEALVFGLIVTRAASALHRPRLVLMIEEIVVTPALRRQGAGRALMRAALDHGRQEGCNEAALDTWQGNKAAQALFAEAGFAPRWANWARPL